MDSSLLSYAPGPGTAIASAVVGLNTDEIWDALRDFCFPIPSFATVVECKMQPAGALPYTVGAIRRIRWQNGDEQLHRLLWLSDQFYVISWEVVQSSTPLAFTGCTATVQLRRVTESNSTVISWITEFSSDLEEGALRAYVADCQRTLSDLRMYLQNVHELLRLRYKPETRRILLLQSAQDSLMEKTAAALENNVLLETLSLGHGTLSAAGVRTLLTGLRGSLVSQLNVASVALDESALDELLSGLREHAPLRALRLLGLPQSAQLVAALESLASSHLGLETVELVWADGSQGVSASLRHCCERNQMLNFERLPMRADARSVAFTVNSLISPELASRVASALISNQHIEAVRLTHSEGPCAATVALLEGILSPESSVAALGLRIAPDAAAAVALCLPAATQGLLNKANGKRSRCPLLRLDLALPSLDLMGSALLAGVLSACTPLRELGIAGATLGTEQWALLADALAENTRLLALETDSAGIADTQAWTDIAGVLARNRRLELGAQVAAIAAGDPSVRTLRSSLVIDAEAVVSGGVAAALRTATAVQQVRLEGMTDAAAVAIAEALMHNNAVLAAAVEGALGDAACEAFTRLTLAKPTLYLRLHAPDVCWDNKAEAYVRRVAQ